MLKKKRERQRQVGGAIFGRKKEQWISGKSVKIIKTENLDSVNSTKARREKKGDRTAAKKTRRRQRRRKKDNRIIIRSIFNITLKRAMAGCQRFLSVKKSLKGTLALATGKPLSVFLTKHFT